METLEDRCEIITKEELEEILSKIKWNFKKISEDFPEYDTSLHSGKQYLGFSDYKDHRKDSDSKLKKLIIKKLKTTTLQKGHFYSSDKTQVVSIYVWGFFGGITGCFKYNNNENAFYR